MGYYHIDRAGSLSVGMELSLFNDFDSPDWSLDGFGDMLKDLFPEGISMHGLQYLKPPAYPDHTYNDRLELQMRILEQNFELCRQAAFPDRPSRFQSLFCIDDIDALANWPELFSPNLSIYEIEPLESSCAPLPSPVPFRADAARLIAGCSPCIADQFVLMNYSLPRDFEAARKYWTGTPTANPKWEWLVPLPARVVRLAARREGNSIRVFDAY